MVSVRRRLSEASDDLLDVAGAAVGSCPFASIVGIGLKPNFVAITTSLRKGARASPTTFFVHVRAIYFGGVEEGDPALDERRG